MPDFGPRAKFIVSLSYSMPYAKLVSAFDIMFNLLRDDTILLLAELSGMLICGLSTFTVSSQNARPG